MSSNPQPTTLSDADEVERHPCPRCGVAPGSPCRARSGAVTGSYHTGRFTKVGRLAKHLRVPIPADRGPGQPWRPVTPPPAPIPQDTPSADIRVGYARCSHLTQELQFQLDALAAHGIPREKIFAEKVSTRVRVRPEFERALNAARQIKAHAPHCRVILSVYEMKRLGRDSAELTALADHLTAHGIALEMLAGPLTGIYDPSGTGRVLFAFFAAMAETERENIREATLEGLNAAARKGNHGGRPPVITDDMLHTVLRRRANGESVAAIRKDLIIPTGKRKGRNPGLASIYRALAEHDKRQRYPEAIEQAHTSFAAVQPSRVAADETATPTGAPSPVAELPRPVRARIIDQPSGPAEREHRDRLVRQRRRRSGPAIRTLACPSCGHEPTTRPEALRQGQDLAVVWLHQDTAHGPITRRQHCATCQPHNTPAAVLECARCGDGPILTGTLATHLDQHGQLPAELRAWLTDHGWRLDPQPLCPYEQP